MDEKKKVSTHEELGGVSHPDESLWDEGDGHLIRPPPDAVPRRNEEPSKRDVSESEKKRMLLS